MTTTPRTIPPFGDLEQIRTRAREELHRGAVTGAYRAERATVLQLLQAALATELVCTLRYTSHKHLAQGLHAEAAAREFAEHAAQEQAHADRVAERITQLGGTPDFHPVGLMERSHAEFGEPGTLREMLEENLVAERVAIEVYGEVIRFIGDDDPTTRRLFEDVLAEEEHHADDLASLLAGERDGRHT